MAIYTWSSIQSFDNWWFWIRKNKCIPNFVNEQNDTDKTYLFERDLNEPKYKILIKKPKDVGIKRLNDPNAFIECSNTTDAVYEKIFMIIIHAEKEKSWLFLMIWLQILWQIKNFKP